MIRVFTRQIERLHSEDGQATVFVALVGLVIFLFFSMTMNVAELVNTKIKNQNVADAAAISAAVWQARTLNLVSAANRNMLEHWLLAVFFWYDTGLLTLGCALTCQQFAIDIIFCVICLVLAAITAGVALSATGGAATNGVFQDLVLEGINMEVVDGDMLQVVQENYKFKASTRSDPVGYYLYYPTQGVDLIRAYVPGQPESGEYVLERVGLCTVLVMLARYLNYIWHQTDEAGGFSDDQLAEIIDYVHEWYSSGGPCFQNLEGLDLIAVPDWAVLFPLGLRSRVSDWSAQNLDSLLAMSVATFKDQEPPPVLGKGAGPADCTWQEGDTQFACPNARHYAFASAHAYSESASEFYNMQMAGYDGAHLIPYIPFEMDWEPRLFPLEPYPGGAPSTRGGPVAYEDFANRIEGDGAAGAYDYLMYHVLQLNGMNFFLY